MSFAIDELLLQVQKKEVEIFDLDLTSLARDFKQQDVDLYPGARFIAGLAHLIYLKAQGLVPPEEEDELVPEDYEALRLQAVEEYASFRDMAKSFSVKEREQSEFFWRPHVLPPEEVPRPFRVPCDLEEFSRLFENIWQQAQERTLAIYEEEWTVADALKIVRIKLTQKIRLTIEELFPRDFSKEQLIVTFLAVLELLKHQEASLIKEQNIWYLTCPQTK
jgi:segregation and condensation protein A